MLSDLLDCNKEEPLQKYLEQHEQILINEFGKNGWAYNMVIPKFRFGSDFVSDFVIMTGQSSSYWVKMVELEPATVPLFTKKGVFAERLNQAIKQVSDWKDWAEHNEAYFKESLQKALDRKYFPKSDILLRYTRRFVITQHIVIGRRETLSAENDIYRANLLRSSGIDIMTYDRLVDVENCLGQKHN